MNILRNVIVITTLAAIAMSGSAQARKNGDGHRMQGQTTRVEQRAGKEAMPNRKVRREKRKQAHGDGYGQVERRQERQRVRIAQGRRFGELSRGEFRRLKKQQRKIARMERRFSSDGHLSGKERRRLERAQDRASRRIARFKHNDIYRGSGDRYAQLYGHQDDYFSRFWRYR